MAGAGAAGCAFAALPALFLPAPPPLPPTHVSGANNVLVAIEPLKAGEGCGLHAMGQASRFRRHAATPRMGSEVASYTLNFDPLPTGSIVLARNSAVTEEL